MRNDGPRFFGFYFFVAVAGSVLIVFGAPFLTLPAPVAEVLAPLDRNASLQKSVAALRGALSWRPAPSGSCAQVVVPAPAPPAVGERAPEVPAGERSHAPIVVRSKPAAPAVQVQPDEPEPAATEPAEIAAPVVQADTNRWGVVVAQDAKVYSRKGKFLAHVEAGALLDVRDVISAEAGTFALASVFGASNRFEEALVSTADIEIRSGALSALREREKELYGGRARAMAELALHKSDCTKYVRKDCPMADEYSRARQHFVELVKTGRALMAKRDAATGNERMRCEDELRMMKGDEVRSGQEYEKIKRQYEEWNRANPEPTGQEKMEVDALQEQLDRIRNELETLAANPS